MIIYQQKSPELAFEAFRELYRRFSQNVYSFLIKKLENEADAEDVMQKVFFKVHESKHLYNNKYLFEQWLFVIARTSVLDHFRASKRYNVRVTNAITGSPESINSDMDLLNSCVDHLDENQKELLKMKYIDELSYEEIAAVLNKSTGSLRKMVSRLVINLRKGEV